MSSRPGMSLGERSLRSGIGSEVAPAASTLGGGSAAGRSGPGAVKHCWVVDSPLSPGRWPGLLLQWRREPGRGWQGLAMWVVDDVDGPVLLQAWVSAEHLHAAG